MHLNRSLMLLLALPLASITACGDDGGNAEGTTSSSTTNDPGTTTNDLPNTTTDDPGTTTNHDSGSSTDESGSSSETTSTPEEMAMIRVMHLGVNAPGVDVFANGEGPAFSNLEFRNSTEYREVPAGDYTFEVSVTMTPASDAVLAPELTLDPNTSYTAVAIGDLDETEGAPGLEAIALIDDVEGIDPANVRITVVHAAPAAGQVDIWEISGDPVLLLPDVDYGVSATLDDIAAGPLEIGIDTDNDEVPDLTFSVDTTPLAGSQLNVYASSDETGLAGFALVAQLPDGSALSIPPN